MSWPKKCTKCNEDVAYNDGSFGNCKKQPGGHSLEAVTYYHPGARDIADQRDRRRFSPIIILIPSYTDKDPKTGHLQVTPGLSVQFNDSQFSTDRPELQWHLDAKGFPSGDEGLRMWRKIVWTEEQQKNFTIAENVQLEETNKRLRETNDLLERTKASMKKPVSV